MNALNMHLIVAICCVLTVVTVTGLPMLYDTAELSGINQINNNNSNNDDDNTLLEHEHTGQLNDGGGNNGLDNFGNGADFADMIKREPKRYNYGKGRRSAGYTYMSSGSSGVKRLPVYNFGLGRKRSSPVIGDGRADQEFEKYVYQYICMLSNCNVMPSRFAVVVRTCSVWVNAPRTMRWSIVRRSLTRI